MLSNADIVRLVIVEPQLAVRDALTALIGSWSGIQVVGASGQVGDGWQQAVRHQADVFLVTVTAEPEFFVSIGQLHAPYPIRIVLLDETSRDAHIHQALRLQVAGYLTKQQPAVQIGAALRQIARGDHVFAPDVAARLELSATGLRLAVGRRNALLETLTAREIDVLTHVAQGYTVKQTAQALGISASTVDNHKSRLMKKLNLHKAVELTHLVLRAGLLPCSNPAHDSHHAIVGK